MKFSKLFRIFIFVLICFNVIVIYQRNYLPGSIDLASNDFLSVFTKITQGNDAVKKMQPQLSGDMSCLCQFGNLENTLAFENINDCRKEPGRLDTQNQIEQYRSLPAFARYLKYEPELVTSSDIPRKCVLYIVKYMEDNPAVKPASYGVCEQKTGYPRRGVGKPCVTEDYINLTYNSFKDVSNCLDINQKHLVPKIMNESGFIMNSWAHLRLRETKFGANQKIEKTSILDPTTHQEDVFEMVANMQRENEERKAKGLPLERDLGIFGGDAGIGQLTASALNDANEYMDSTLREIRRKAEKGHGSCQRVADFIADTKMQTQLDASLSNRCEVVALPDNPIKSLIIMGIIKRNFQRYVKDKWKAEGIDDLMDQAGLRSFDRTEIQEALALLAYNSGAGTAVILYKNWLKMRLENVRRYPIKSADLSFDRKSTFKYKDKSIISMMPDEANSLRGKIKELDHLDFGTFMMIYREQNRWARGYLYSVRDMAKNLEEKMGKGTCTDSAFLSQ